MSMLFAALMLLGAAGVPVDADAQSSDDPSPHSEAALVSDVSAIAPGEPFTVALRLRMEKGWHSYWKNPGDSGEPTSVDWAVPEGFAVGDIQWPYPHRVPFGPMTSYGYSDEVVLPFTVTPPETLAPGSRVTLKGEANWLICADICLPAKADVQTTLSVAEAPRPSPEASVIAKAESKQPRSVDGWTVQAARSSGSYTLALTSPAGHEPSLKGAYFFPAQEEVLDHAAPQPVSRADDTHLITLQQSSYAEEPSDSLRGVVVAPDGETWDAAGEVRALRVNVPVDSTLSGIDVASMTAASTGGNGLSLPWALAFAFAGGLLLNLMPCVFPVISVKILGFAEQAEEEERTIRTHGTLFGVGVLVSMWVLAGILLAVRAAGSQVGWGFQLQSPTFIALMALLFFGIGLNLLGLFEVGTRLMSWGGRLQTQTSSDGRLGAFLTGVLATVVATPCTAPFMGAALGVALTLSTTGALLIFTSLGVGMAAPYVGLSMAPRLLKALPKPGAWMESLKQFFAFPMFATAIWLVWVFGQQTGNGGVALLLFGLLLLGMAGWVVHRWSASTLSQPLTVVTRGLVTLMVVGAVAAGVIGAGYDRPATASSSDSSSAASSEQWTPFSPQTVQEFRAEGRPVFVDFTAAWCLTCQVNERTVLNTDAVQSAFRKRNVALVKADWTNRDPQITKALESHGRSGVPVYVLYPGDGSGPTLLPEVLTQDIVLNALEKLPSSS
ncbi:thiol:disulfide interchange protein [Salinibacter sp. 10B]|nr:thiol:disulfide interchange protein [Salinibacter sp. 10B]